MSMKHYNFSPKKLTRYYPSLSMTIIPINLLFTSIFISQHSNILSELIKNYSICNEKEQYECLCSENKLESKIVRCDSFIEDKLNLMCLMAENLDLKHRLYTGETYEQYLRRRIANVLTHYCNKHPTECPGTVAESRYLAKIKASNQLEMITYFDNGEPVFGRENVLILKANSTKSETEVCFTVTKKLMRHAERLDYASTMDPTIIKQIFLEQIAPLSRVLGGVNIVKIRISKLKRRLQYSDVDNGKLLVVVSIGLGFVIISWSIWIFWQLCRGGHWNKFKRNFKSIKKTSPNNNNYGTCTDRMHEKNNNSIQIPNGNSRLTKASPKNSRNSSTRSKKHLLSSMNEKMDENTNNRDVRTPDDSTRICQNIFVCDHSQLPKEELEISVYKNTYFEPYEYEIGDYKRRQKEQRRRSDMDAQQRDGMLCAIQIENCLSANKRFGKFEQWKNEPQTKTGGDMLLVLEDIGRPLSRRGSWDDKQEEGIEETFGSREDTPQPVGDEAMNIKLTNEFQCIPMINIHNGADVNEETTKTYKYTNNEEAQKFEMENEESNASDEDGFDELQQYQILRESPLPFNVSKNFETTKPI